MIRCGPKFQCGPMVRCGPTTRCAGDGPDHPGPDRHSRAVVQLILSIAAVFFSIHASGSGALPAASAAAAWPSAEET